MQEQAYSVSQKNLTFLDSGKRCDDFFILILQNSLHIFYVTFKVKHNKIGRVTLKHWAMKHTHLSPQAARAAV